MGARLAALIAALTVLGVGIGWGTRVAGGSDSYCYVEQAERFAAGTMHHPIDTDFVPPWRDVALSLAPTGFIPSPVRPGAIAPICPAGYALAMVPFRLAGGPKAMHLVVPVFGALLVWLTYVAGVRAWGGITGAFAAIQVATAPVLLYQVVQPMSDVPAAAWWLAAIVLVLGARTDRAGAGADRRPRREHLRLAGAGLATAAAVLTRPNLVGLAVVLLAAVALRPRATGATLPARTADALAFCAGAAPGAIALVALQTWLYGSPTSSGYGSLAFLFSGDHILPNATRYARWLVETQTPIVWLAPLALWVMPRAARRAGVEAAAIRDGRWLTMTLGAVIAVVIASYLPYVPFDDWSYLRFLLPALPPIAILTSATLVALFGAERGAHAPTAGSRERSGAALVTIVVIGIVIAALGVRTAIERRAFALRTIEAKFRVAGDLVDRDLPPGAVVFTVWHSGSVRYYGHRLSVVWDALSADELAPAVSFLAARDRPAYFLLERWEEPAFRARFAVATPLGAIDWPPVARIGRDVSLYAAADRERYFAGARIDTIWIPLERR